MIIKITLFAIASLLSLLGCSNASQSKDRNVNKSEKLAIETCAILKSGKWHAWLDTYPQEKGSYRLNVVGEVRLPSPSYDLVWIVGPTDSMKPPRLSLFLKTLSQGGISAQVITDVTARYEMTTPIAHYHHLSIVCGNKLLEQIIDVQLTD